MVGTCTLCKYDDNNQNTTFHLHVVDAPRQKAWDTPQVTASFQAPLNSAPDTPARAWLLAASMKEAGVWLQALPVFALGLHMDDDVMRITMGLRLGLPLCQPHRCHFCGTPLDH